MKMSLNEFKSHLTDMNRALSDHYENEGYVDLIEVDTAEKIDIHHNDENRGYVTSESFTYRFDGVTWMVAQFFSTGEVDEWELGSDLEPHRMNSVQEWKDYYVSEMTEM